VLLHVLLVQQVDGQLGGRPASIRTGEDAFLQAQQQQQQQQQQRCCTSLFTSAHTIGSLHLFKLYVQ
jgi:hypothetical protein